MNRDETGEERRYPLDGMKKPRGEKKRRRMMLAARMLSSAGTDTVQQSQKSFDETYDRLRELHQELAGERAKSETAVPARPWYIHWAVLVGSLAAAAALIVALVLFFLPGRGPGGRSIGTFEAELGKIAVTDADGGKTVGAEGDEIEVFEEYTVETLGDSRAILRMSDGSEVRFDSSTMIALGGKTDGFVRANLLGGNCYNRILEGTNYRLSLDGLEIVGSGCSFNTDLRGGSATILAVSNSIFVSNDLNNRFCNEGRKLVASEPFSTADLETEEITAEDTSSPWFVWNLELDKESSSETEVPGDTREEKPVEQATPPETTAPTDQPDDGEHPRPTTGSASLSVQAGPVENVLSWSIDGVPPSPRVFILRSESNPEGTYPADAYREVDASSRSLADTAISGGVTYYYRITVLSGGSPAFYSNSAQASVPLWGEASLSASLDGGAANLSWSSRANFQVTGIAVIRSGDGSEPSFPPPVGQDAWLLPAASTSYVDSSIEANRQYRYRVAILSGSRAIAYSNTVTVELKASSSD